MTTSVSFLTFLTALEDTVCHEKMSERRSHLLACFLPRDDLPPSQDGIFNRATMRIPKWDFTPPPDATGVIEALEDSLKLYLNFETTFNTYKVI